jgi:hypothetical protein
MSGRLECFPAAVAAATMVMAGRHWLNVEAQIFLYKSILETRRLSDLDRASGYFLPYGLQNLLSVRNFSTLILNPF